MASQYYSWRQNSLNPNNLRTWFSCSHKGVQCCLRPLSPPKTTVGYSPWPTGDICPRDMTSAAWIGHQRAAQIDAYGLAFALSDTPISFQFLKCILFSTFSCRVLLFLQLDKCSACTLFSFYLQSYSLLISSVLVLVSKVEEQPPSLQLMFLPGNCQQGWINTILILIPILFLNTKIYYCNALLILHRKQSFKIKSKLQCPEALLSVLKEKNLSFLNLRTTIQVYVSVMLKGCFKHLVGQEIPYLFSVEHLQNPTAVQTRVEWYICYRNSCWKAL